MWQSQKPWIVLPLPSNKCVQRILKWRQFRNNIGRLKQYKNRSCWLLWSVFFLMVFCLFPYICQLSLFRWMGLSYRVHNSDKVNQLLSRAYLHNPFANPSRCIFVNELDMILGEYGRKKHIDGSLIFQIFNVLTANFVLIVDLLKNVILINNF